ncbi:hypothetical protein KJ940_00250, partial [Myxococcota bacterium]|nr:hypothetical protein [Myxococcota bacterium]
MRASLFGILWGLLGGSLSACGAPVARPEPGRAPSVLLISVDGLSPDLLRQHLARPQSQGPDRGLRRLIEGAAGARVGEALTPLPSGPSAGAEALLKTPQGPLFEGVGGGLSVGFEAPGAEIMRPQGDEARIKAAAAGLAAHRLVALRLTGLVEAMSEGGVAAGLPALAVLDQRLGALVDALPPYALVILTATHGAAALPSEKTARDKAAFARFLKIDEARLEPAGGLLFVSGCQGEIIAQLGGMPFIAGLYQRGEGGALLRFDPNAGLMRPATPADAPPHAQIQAALASREGVCAAVARRDEGYEFTAPGFDGGKIGWGGPAAARVALIIAGPITPGAFDAPVPLAEAPALAAASLGAPVTSALQARLSPSPEARGLPSPLRARPDLAAWVSTPPYRAARLTALEATPIPDARPLPFKLDVAEAAAVAGALGLEAISFGREVLSTTPHLARFGAPAYFVGRAEPGTTKALSALALADRHLSLGRAALAFEALIDADLKALPSAARPWAEILLALSARLSPPEGDASPPAFPEIAQGQPAAAFNQLAQGLVWPNQGPHPWTSLVGAAPYAQLPALVEETRFCAQDYAARRTRRLAAAAALRADWPGLAAYILSAHIGEGAIEARRAAVIEVLDLLDDPRAAWRRGEILSGLLNRFLFTQGLAAQLPELHRRAARAYLLHLQGEILADPHPERNQGRLNGLLSGAAQVESALQEQTIRLAAGDEGNLATAILRGVLSQGGLLSFLNPEFLQHLVRVRASVAEALAPVLAKPLAALTPEERLTRALLAQLDALLAGLQGQMPAAKARLSEAEALLDDPRFEAAYEAALKLKPEAEAPLIAWGRASLALTRVALGIIAAIEQDKATATARLTAGVEILHAMSLALLDAQGLAALRGHADALAALLKAATRLTALGQGEAPDQALLAEVFGVAAGLRLDVPEGEAAGVGRWLVLGGLILRDVVWIIDVLARGEAADLKALAGAEAAWAALRAGWAPESRVGQALLSLSEVAQALLPKLPALKDGAAEAWLGALTAVEAQGLRAQLSHALSEAELRAKLRAGEVEWIFLHYLRKLLDLNLITLKDPQTLLAFIDGENRALLALMGEDASGPTRPLIALLQATLHPGEAGVTWAEKGKAWSAGTVFEEAPFLWDLLAWERVAAPARLEAIAAACPPIKPSVDLVAARLEARA